MINEQLKSITPTNIPVIAGVGIRTDNEGRYNLNDLHRANECGVNKAPSQWFRTKQAKEQINELERQTMQICTVSVEGRNGGTFAHELLAVSYAGWISPAFQLKVNQTFINSHRSPRSSELSRMEILQLAMDSELKCIEQQAKIEQDAPKVEFAERVEVAEDAISVAKAAKICETGQNRLYAFLRQNSWVNRRNEPYQKIIEQGYMDVKISKFQHPTKGLDSSVTALVTGKGLLKLQQIYNGGPNVSAYH